MCLCVCLKGSDVVERWGEGGWIGDAGTERDEKQCVMGWNVNEMEGMRGRETVQGSGSFDGVSSGIASGGVNVNSVGVDRVSELTWNVAGWAKGGGCVLTDQIQRYQLGQVVVCGDFNARCGSLKDLGDYRDVGASDSQCGYGEERARRTAGRMFTECRTLFCEWTQRQ